MNGPFTVTDLMTVPNPRLIDADYHEVPAKLAASDNLLKKHLGPRRSKVIMWISSVENIRTLLSKYVSAKALHAAKLHCAPVDS